jgi:hypothetical protein
LKYLGIPVSDKILFAADLMAVGVKVEKRLPSWQGLQLFSGGESILIESSLSSLPNYIMGAYLHPGQVHHKMDSARARFYWDADVKRKYHMVKWEVMAKPREFGGLGFTDTRLMN